MKTIILLAGLLLHGIALAQTAAPRAPALDYNYAELRFVDVDDANGDGFRLNGSFELQNNWLIVGGLTSLDFDNGVDTTLFEIGGGYVWNYSPEWDMVGNLRFVRADVDTRNGSDNENGFAFSAGTRGLLTPQFEMRGSVNYINLDRSDTYLELGNPLQQSGLSVL